MATKCIRHSATARTRMKSVNASTNLIRFFIGSPSSQKSQTTSDIPGTVNVNNGHI